VFDSVYPPSEDSELLAESLRVPADASVLDLGCGSGIQGIQCAKLGASSVTFADLNPLALRNARQNCKKNAVKCQKKFMQSDLFSNIREKFDVVIFNPPYVPSDAKKFLDTDGGKKGREVLDRFLVRVGDFLLPDGSFFFLQTSLNGENATQKLLKHLGFEFRIAGRKKLFFEELIVFKAWKKKHRVVKEKE